MIDPVNSEDLERFNQLTGARQALADRLLGMETEKIKLMAAARRIDTEWDGLFNQIRQDRGIEGPFDVDPKSGVIRMEGTESITPNKSSEKSEEKSEKEPNSALSEEKS